MNVLIRLAVYIILGLVQVLILNHIHIWNCMTPLLNVYFVLTFNRNSPKWATLLWSFALGLCIDIFSNTPGVAAAAMTLAAVLQPYILNLFIQRDNEEDISPSIKSLGFTRYLYYALIMVLIYCTCFLTLETFTFFDWQLWLLNIGGSMVLTMALILAVDNLRKD